MTPERWRQIEEIFHGALDRVPADRKEFLDRQCGDDAELRAEVESLLSQPVADTFLAMPIESAAHAVSRDAADVRIGQRVGAYRLTALIGQGGMGAVYCGVRDDDQYRKQVAIKLVRRGMDTDSLLRRFRHERQILASLDHPHIARLLDGGTTDDGVPYLVMDRWYRKGHDGLHADTGEGLDFYEVGRNRGGSTHRGHCLRRPREGAAPDSDRHDRGR